MAFMQLEGGQERVRLLPGQQVALTVSLASTFQMNIPSEQKSDRLYDVTYRVVGLPEARTARGSHLAISEISVSPDGKTARVVVTATKPTTVGPLRFRGGMVRSPVFIEQSGQFLRAVPAKESPPHWGR